MRRADRGSSHESRDVSAVGKRRAVGRRRALVAAWTSRDQGRASPRSRPRRVRRNQLRAQERHTQRRRPSTEIRLGVHLQPLTCEPSLAFHPQSPFTHERDPPTEGQMEKYKPHPAFDTWVLYR